MSRPATTRLKVNPPLGHLPALQYLLPAQLSIDPTYQRNLETGPSQTLIRRIAQFWNWDLCQPLVVARRDGGELFVIDGQHRLEAARLRGDIAQLPAVVVQYASVMDEAASFVHLNQQRRPLSKLDVFKAAVASEDPEAAAIKAALTEAGLSIPNTTNPDMWKPGQIVNIGGIERAWRHSSPATAKLALNALAEGFQGQVLRYAGTIYPGIVAVCKHESPAGDMWPLFIKMLGSKSQPDWRKIVYENHAQQMTLSRREAAERAFRVAWREAIKAPSQQQPPPPPPPSLVATPRPAMVDHEGKAFCGQCDRRVTPGWAKTCIDKFCAAKVRA